VLFRHLLEPLQLFLAQQLERILPDDDKTFGELKLLFQRFVGQGRHLKKSGTCLLYPTCEFKLTPGILYFL